ncbi:hypothetical protein AAHH86_00140 [Candidatus Hodgkinia cicadicola]
MPSQGLPASAFKLKAVVFRSSASKLQACLKALPTQAVVSRVSAFGCANSLSFKKHWIEPLATALVLKIGAVIAAAGGHKHSSGFTNWTYVAAKRFNWDVTVDNGTQPSVLQSVIVCTRTQAPKATPEWGNTNRCVKPKWQTKRPMRLEHTAQAVYNMTSSNKLKALAKVTLKTATQNSSASAPICWLQTQSLLRLCYDQKHWSNLSLPNVATSRCQLESTQSNTT